MKRQKRGSVGDDERMRFQENGIIDRILPQGEGKAKDQEMRWTTALGMQVAQNLSSRCRSEQRKLSDKKINCILLDPYKCC